MKQNPERGMFLILLALLMVPIIGLTGLVLDITRLQIAVSQLQNAADAASLAGAAQLKMSDLAGWKNAKKAVLLTIANSTISQLNSATALAFSNQTARYRAGTVTPYDGIGYDHTAVHIASGNLGVTVTRSISCISNSLTRINIGLEYGSSPYCVANTVTVDLSLTNIPNYFARIFGYNTNNVNVTATAQLKKSSGDACDIDYCHLWGSYSGGTFTVDPTLVPLPCS